MEIFKWTNEYETGIEMIDTQHKELFGQIDTLALSVYRGRSKLELSKLLQFFSNYVEEHFADEEELMMLSHYPDMERHINQHEEFSSLFRSIRREFENKGPDEYMAIRLEKEVRKWWANHILGVDMRYVPYVKKSRENEAES